MANRERRKGLEYEREIARVWREHGFEVQDLQHNVAELADQRIVGHGLHLLSDPKRQETLRIPLWIRQMEWNVVNLDRELDGWVIPFRQSGHRHHPPKSYAIVPHDALVRMLAR